MPPAGRPRSFDRETALQKAMHVFWAKGFEGTTMMDLVEAIGVKAPSVYAAFGNKDKIFKEAVALYGKLMADGPFKELEHQDIYEAVKNSLNRSIDIYTSPNNPASCLIMTAAINCAPESKAHEADLRNYRLGYKEIFRKRLDQALADGQLKEAANAEWLADYFLTVTQGLAIRAKDGADKETLQATANIALSGLIPFLTFNQKNTT